MTAPSHITFAELLYFLLLTTMGVSLSAVNIFVIGISSLLADIDTEASTIGIVARGISTRIERRFGHRTITHSALFIAGISILAIPLYLIVPEIYLCFIVGYASHPFLDTMTVTGVKLFYPLSAVNCVFPFEVNSPHRYRIQSGGRGDRILSVLFLAGCVPTFLVANQGYERFIRVTQKNIEAAVRDYNAFSKDHSVFAELTGYSMLTREPLTGRFQAVGAIDPRTLVFKDGAGKLRTLGKDFQADYVAEKIVCRKGSEVDFRIREVDMSNQILSQLKYSVDPSAENYFFGELLTSDNVALPEEGRWFTTVSGRGKSIKLNYASYDDICERGVGSAFVTSGTVMVKSIAPKGGGGAYDAGSSAIHGAFERFSVKLSPDESIRMIKSPGDTLSENETVAIRSSTRFFAEQISLNDEKIRMTASQRILGEEENERRISAAELKLKSDSAEYRNMLELREKGFADSAFLESARLKVNEDRKILSGLISSRISIGEKASHEIRRINLLNQQLRSKQKEADQQGEIRSNCRGILREAKRQYLDDKLHIIFIIKRIP